MKARKARGNFLLLLTAMIWGSSFVAQSAGADLISPAFFNGTRMLLGSLLLSPLAVYRMRRYVPASSRRTLLLGGACCGVLMFTGSYIQQTGIAYTTAGKAGFLTAIYVVLVPVLGIFLKKKPRPILWVSVALACVGLYFLCFTDKTFSLAMGDAAMLGGAVMFALHIMVVDHFSPLVACACPLCSSLRPVRWGWLWHLSRNSPPLRLLAPRQCPFCIRACLPWAWPIRCKLWPRRTRTPRWLR